MRIRKSVQLSCLLVTLFLFFGLSGGFAQDCDDDRVEAGIKLYDEGKFNRAIQELRSFTKKLQDGPKDRSRGECLFKANLYIGMAYLGTGKESQAKEHFSMAAEATPCRTLNPDYYPPKVISLYENACNLVARPTGSTIIVKCNVPDADVFVDGVSKGKAPITIPDIPVGQHTVKVLYGSQKMEQTYTVESGQRLEVTFDFPTLGHISVSSDPHSANISLDGTLQGAKTPSLVSDCSAGEHTLGISKDGFKESIQKVTVKANEVTNVSVRLEPLLYAIKIASMPSGADVLLDGAPKGKTPLTIDNVAAGIHKISISKEDYEGQIESIEVKNASIERNYRLNQYAGTVRITTDPSGAEVFIDGKQVGTTPFQGRYPSKNYALRLRKDGFKDRNVTFDVVKDRETTLNEKLLMIDTQPPEVVVEPAARIIKENKYHLRAMVSDDQAVGDVSLLFRLEGEGKFQTIRMMNTGTNLYEAAIPDMYLKKDAAIEYYLVACDMQENCAKSGREDAPYKRTVTSVEPYTEGYVLDIDKDKKTVTISLGTMDGINSQDKLYVFRLGQRYTDPKTGDVLGIREELVGVLAIKELMARTSFALITEQFSGLPPIGKDDRIRRRSGPPTGIRSEGRYANRVVLRWAPNLEPEVRGYAVYRSSAPNGEFERLEEVSGRENAVYEDKKEIRENRTYYYRIAAVNKLGTASVLSEPCMAQSKKGVLPPEGVRAERGRFREIILAWDTTRRDPDIESYLIYRSTAENGEFQEIGQVRYSYNEYTDKWNLSDGKMYYYRIAGKSTYGAVGDMSKVASARTRGGPLPPEQVSAQGNLAKEVKIEWEDVGVDKEVKGYNVWRKESEDGNLTLVETTGRNMFVDTNVADGRKYYYCVNGYYRYQGKEIRGDCSRTVVAETRPRPRTPTGFSAEGGLPRKVTLKWDKSTDKEVVEYWIDRRKGEASGPKATGVRGFFDAIKQSLALGRMRVKANTNQYTDTGLDDNTMYYYTIRAVDIDLLESNLSSEVSARTKPTPAAPSGLKTQIAGNKIILTWDANKEQDIVAYKVYRKASFVGSNEYLVTIKDTSYESEAREGSKFEFLVTAIDSDELESGFSAPAEAEIKK
jgi:fibronectin type 3 domain-containing protein